MFSTSRVPLAWRNLVHRKLRFVVALAGVTFAVVLMFAQVGFWTALLDGPVRLIRTMNADLVMLHRAKYSMTVMQPFSRRRVEQALAVPGVRDARPLYMDTQYFQWKSLSDEPIPLASRSPCRDKPPTVRPICVLAFDIDPNDPLLNLPEVYAQVDKLSVPDAVLIDDQSKGYYLATATIDRELSEQHVNKVGTFTLGRDFAIQGTLIMSDRNYARLFPIRSPSSSPLDQCEVGLIRLEPGQDAGAVRRALQRALSGLEVTILTRDEFVLQEQRFWSTATPVGFIFMLGMGMGFLVGCIICYQILSTDVTDHLPEYATLKAMGYSNNYLTGVVLRQGVILALIGFLPGVVVSVLLYWAFGWWTGMPFRMGPGVLGGILVLTVAMCVLSGLLVIRRVQVADPAEVFS